jgi:hypothetical protein
VASRTARIEQLRAALEQRAAQRKAELRRTTDRPDAAATTHRAADTLGCERPGRVRPVAG